MRRTLLLPLALCLGCAAEPDRSIVQAPDAAEVEFIVSVLSQDCESCFRAYSGTMIEGQFSLDYIAPDRQSYEQLTQKLLEEACDSIPVELIQDFCAKNATPQDVWQEIGAHLPVFILKPGETDSVMAAADNAIEAWDRLRARYPGSRRLLLTISRVGFNREHDIAMWYVGGGTSMIGSGGISIYRKQGSTWVRQVLPGYTWIT